jgi:hypothetical protein
MILTTITPVNYPIHTGNREVFVGIGNGPSSYNQTTGDILSVASNPFNIDAVLGLAVTTDGTYIGIPVPIAVSGRNSSGGWTIFWYAFATSGGGTPAWTALGSGASIATKQVQLTVIGGA